MVGSLRIDCESSLDNNKRLYVHDKPSSLEGCSGTLVPAIIPHTLHSLAVKGVFLR